MRFSENLRRLREAIGTQKEASELVGVHVNTICEFETGKRMPKVYRQRQILGILEDRLLEMSQAELIRKRKLNGIV